jgi:hypothetical protein
MMSRAWRRVSLAVSHAPLCGVVWTLASPPFLEFHGSFDYSTFKEEELTQLDYCSASSSAADSVKAGAAALNATSND